MIKKILLFILIIISNSGFACDCLSFEKATKKALAENKLILAHFGSTFNVDDNKKGYLKIDGLTKEEEVIFNDKFVYVCIPNFYSDSKKKKYNIGKSSELLVIDVMGTELYRFTENDTDYHIYNVLTNFSNSIPNLSSDIAQFEKKQNYYSGIRIAQKYYDFAVDKEDILREKILNVANRYAELAKETIKKSDRLAKVKSQNFELIKIYCLAFIKRFDVINERISLYNESEIVEENKSLFFSLKYLSSKKMKKSDIGFVEEKFKSTENYEYFLERVNMF